MAENSSSGYRWQLPQPPAETDSHRLRILNSFSRKKELFVPNENKTIKWYSCGPTVYDVAHLGHARCYITFDIIRRLLANYFGYQVFYVMNITDIDDKIIKRARSNHLCDQFIENIYKNQDGDSLNEIERAIDNFVARRSEEKDAFKVDMYKGIEAKSREAIKKLRAMDVGSPEHRDILEQLRDVIADEQDVQLSHTVTDHQIFKALTLKFEQEYHEDMQRLDVLPPNALTRVSEYIDEVGAYIKRLESNGFAYRAGGSVYFDTEKFDSDEKHSYAKLVREAFGQKKSLDEGEGELSAPHDAKKSPNDFALWKKSKVGEPTWVTQNYEPGRPGWHIECSVMASHLLGENFDIHSGGCDLKFPHHDNEIAQAEAYYNTGKNWVNYFVHSGHLSISGCKMSKSLKNFITIRQALQQYTARQLRFAFLAHSWAEELNYSPDTMKTAVGYERTFKEFFLNVSDTLRRKNKLTITSGKVNQNSAGEGVKLCDFFRKWTPDDHELNKEFMSSINKVDVALCDNLDTRTTLNILAELVKATNKKSQADSILLKDIACYIDKMLKIFGTNFAEVGMDRFVVVELPGVDTGKSNSSSHNDVETVFKYVDALAQFRADVRRISKAGEPQQSVKDILALCDTLRDKTLPELGVRLEDKEADGAPYVVKLLDPETIAKEKALLKRREQEKELKEEMAKLEKLKLQQQREDKMKIPPSEMFRSQTDKYSKFDDKGMPTHDIDGKEVTKSALKKLQRLYEQQEVKYNKYIAEQQISTSAGT